MCVYVCACGYVHDVFMSVCMCACMYITIYGMAVWNQLNGMVEWCYLHVHYI